MACKSDNFFKGFFANEELWLDDSKLDEMRANVVALGLFPCFIQERGQQAAALQVKPKLKIKLTFTSSNHNLSLLRSRPILEPKPEDVLQTERL